VDDGRHGVVDGEQQGSEPELGKSDLEQGLVDCCGCQDGDDLFWRGFAGGGRLLEAKVGIVR
jgi:hypothetical protein